MAFLGILDRPESTGDRFAKAFSGAGQAIGQGVVKHFEEQKQKQQRAKSAQILFQLTGLDVNDLGGADPETFRELVKLGAGKSLELDKIAGKERIEMIKADAKLAQQKQKEADTLEQVAGADNTINQLLEIVDRGSVGYGSVWQASLNPFAEQARGDTAEFDSLTGGLESHLVDLVSRGTLSNARFKYITQTLLPKSNDSVATIKGKLSGIRKVLVDEVSQISADSTQEDEGPKELTLDVLQKIKAQAGGDVQKAKRIAKKMGYSV